MTIQIGDILLWTIIRDRPCYVLHHEKGKIKVIEIGDRFIIGEEYDKAEDYFEKYHAIPISRIISKESFKIFQEDREDFHSQIEDMLKKIFKKP